MKGWETEQTSLVRSFVHALRRIIKFDLVSIDAHIIWYGADDDQATHLAAVSVAADARLCWPVASLSAHTVDDGGPTHMVYS